MIARRDPLLALRRPDRLHPRRLPAGARRAGSPVSVAESASSTSWRSPVRAQELPRVSLIIPAYDEEEVIAAKVANALALDYPRERLQIIVASDGSADATVERARAAGADLVLDLPRRRQGRRPQRRRRAGDRRAARLLRRQQRAGRRTHCSAWSSPSPTPPSATSAARSASSTPGGGNLEGAYWRYEMAVREMESALGGVTAGNGAIYAVRRDAYLPLAAVRQSRPLLPLPAGQARTALALRAGGAGGGEDGSDPGGRVRPQTADDGRTLGHRRRRRDALSRAATRRCSPSSSPRTGCCATSPRRCTSLALAANIALLGQGWVYAVTLALQLALLAAALLGRWLPLAPLRVRPLLRDDDRLDRRRPLGPLAPRRARPLGEGRGDPLMPRAFDIADRRPGAARPLALPARRRDRDQARQPRPGLLPAAPRRPRRRASSRC